MVYISSFIDLEFWYFVVDIQTLYVLYLGPPRVPPVSPHQNSSVPVTGQPGGGQPGGQAGALVNTSGSVPVPAKCSSQLRKLIQSHSIAEEVQSTKICLVPPKYELNLVSF